MKIYFYTNQYLNNPEAKEILSYLRRGDSKIINNLSKSSSSLSENQSLDKVDTFIFQGKELDTNVTYITALALAQNKEVLYLLPEGTKIDQAINDLKNDSGLAQKFHIEYYNSQNLKEKVFDFLQALDKDSVRELFNIKYTLRISGKISDYLNWKSNQLNIRKADWLREQIQEKIKKDTKYQEFLKKKFKN